jgi:CRISPR-associated exonuclease Cas4
MKIERIKIHNWRSIGDVDIYCRDMMIFIGQNNHGKSNVLSALLFFFGEISCSDLDFKRGEDNLFVELVFCDLDEHDKMQFKKYLTSDNTIKVRKEISKGENFEYHGYCEIPQEDWLKEENVGNFTNRSAIESLPLKDYIPEAGRITKDIIREAQNKYIEENIDKIDFNYEIENSNFLGLKTVAQGIFGNVFFIPAVKSADEEFSLKKKTVFNDLLSNVINEMSCSSEPYRAAKKQIEELTNSLNKNIASEQDDNKRPEQLTNLEIGIEEELKKWNTKIDIEITPPDIDEVLKVGTNVWVDDGIPTDIRRKGNGLQRALIFALIKSWAKIFKQNQKSDSEKEESKRKASNSNYFLFEEPELYLHPQAQKELYSSLKELAEFNNQVLLTTHSSSFINLKTYKSICIIFKDDIKAGTKKLQCTEDLFDLESDKNNFNLSYWINPDRGELFFAKKIILVEGATDKVVISYLAKQLSVFRYDYSIIDCGSKDVIKIYLHLLNKFKLPYIIAYDKDHQSNKDKEAKDCADKSSKAIEEKIDNSLGGSIIFDNDIEEEIGLEASCKNKPYLALQHISSNGFQMSQSLEEKIKNIFK